MRRKFNLLCATVVVAVLLSAVSARAVEPLRIYAAGSLTDAFTEIAAAFPVPPGSIAAPVFGPSGSLRQRIEKGEAADLLASADMTQPRALAKAQAGRFVAMFTRNRLCVLGRADLHLTPESVLDRMLDPAVRVATSTPGADPGGDYAWAVFARAEALHPGARAILEAKALKLVGGPDTKPLVPGRGQVEGVFLSHSADLMLGYCSSGEPVVKALPDLVNVRLPEALTVGPAYGLVVLSDHPLAARFALFVLSEQGQAILQRHGFDPIGVAGP
ncbi:MAG: substrate-binding domain-containing protein [Acetobacteraceae bacterium]|nr:substrate-binding domain-containing protein [Acetobacteraceae bacterium]